MPGVLLETAFHDNVRQSQSSDLKMTDNQALHDPRFRETLAYGIYQGISQYFGESEHYLALAPDIIFAKKQIPERLKFLQLGSRCTQLPHLFSLWTPRL